MIRVEGLAGTAREVLTRENDRRFERVMAGIGNSEAKATALLVLATYPQSMHQLKGAFNDTTNGVWRDIDPGTIGGWMEKSLAPNGLAQETPSPTAKGYFVTPEGQDIGQPIAKFLLSISANSPHSLSEMFGRTSEGPGDSRPVVNRIKLLDGLLLATGPVYSSDLERATQLPKSVILRHIRDLGLAGFVDHSPLEGRQRPKAQITDSGKRFIKEVLQLIRNVVAGESPRTLEQWRRLPWVGNATSGVAKHKERSRNIPS